MSEEQLLLPDYVLNNYAKARTATLESWLDANPLPSICEPKLDGVRVFLFKSGEKLVAATKHGAVYTPKGNPKVFSQVPEFVHAPYRAILDGEYIPSEGLLFFFDVLRVDDRDVRGLALRGRKKILREILDGTNLEVPWRLVWTPSEILGLKEEAVGRGEEGIMVKNPDSSYGESNSWLKLKRFDTIDCFVIDYEETTEMERTGVPHSWHVGVYDGKGQVVNLGKVGSYVEKVDPRQVRVGSVVEIRFQEVTDDLRLRAPFILRVRHDKAPEECLMTQIGPKRQGRGGDPL
jgi:ATP-dependent DNA ligase